ncbi:ArsR/SmtB family transcription factor [Sandaracinus amylolyticus]|uniref:ArsR/SmtB family transcription factor n=1 Tax=Sandaracinus amylolyticus TaxID=927083 RepID=UPI001F2E908A|nr:metalloregulator ArsR/SmtB family transcription factor [Sandaracinus amylolyticus]UJR82989.1 Hypothetical protein I5071_50540 [Sandaracinus amylolyticus]
MARNDLRDRCDTPAVIAPRSIRGHAPLLRALADEARLEIVARLAAAGRAVCVCDITPGLGLAQPTVSHHLKVLKDAGVVCSERRGSWVYYSLDFSIVGALGDLISALAPPRQAALEAPEKLAKEG